ncbi:Crp/Fnr family transcriptional regulator [uncultured Tenacibaculum sp.]|uniref:Crp/Fnr family transcriptional regulator n=1 Tax=uncultured Tenacibaculum sp. TaxID=174713 RepID=UPI00263223CD|nr:Crp/Fnr family transcriptional regulator [uncultured Tenacibaculum sp.]
MMEIDLITSLLRSYVSNLSDEAIQLFSSFISLKEYPRDHIVIKNKSQAKKFYIIKSGIVGSFAQDKRSEKEYIRAIHNDKTIFTNISSLDKDDNRSVNYYKCLSKCIVYQGSYPEFIEQTHLNHELSNLYNRILEDALLKSQKRIDELSFMDATQRYQALKNNIPNIENLIAQYQIASYLSVTPVQLSRIRKKMYSQ